MKIHIVKEGDTLYSLSEKYNVDLEKIVAANPEIIEPSRVEPGKKVKIPKGPVSPKAAVTAPQKPKTDLEAEKYFPPVPKKAEMPEKISPAEAKPPAAEAPKAEVPAEKKVSPAAKIVTAPKAPEPKAAAPKVQLGKSPDVTPLPGAQLPMFGAPMQQHVPQAVFPGAMVPATAPYLPPVGFGMPAQYPAPFPQAMMGYPFTAAPEQLPMAFKTDMQHSAHSPLNVKLKGYDEGAVHPFAQFPTPAVEAGAFTNPHFGTPSFTQGVPFDQPYQPFGTFAAPGAMGQSFNPAFGFQPFGMMPATPFTQGFPGAAVQHEYPFGAMHSAAFGFPMADCGCGGMHKRPPLPYALPSTETASDSASVSGFPAEPLESTDASLIQAEETIAASKPGENSKKRSRAEAVRRFLGKTKANRKSARRESRPWIYN